MNRAYCYRKLWRKPITIHKLGKGDVSVTFSKGIEVRQIIVALLIFAAEMAFRQYINGLIPSFMQWVVFLGFPWFAAGWLIKANVEGKRLDRYIVGVIRYIFTKRQKYSNYKPIYQPQMNKKQRYEEVNI